MCVPETPSPLPARARHTLGSFTRVHVIIVYLPLPSENPSTLFTSDSDGARHWALAGGVPALLPSLARRRDVYPLYPTRKTPKQVSEITCSTCRKHKPRAELQSEIPGRTPSSGGRGGPAGTSDGDECVSGWASPCQ